MNYKIIIPVYNEEKYLKRFLDTFDLESLKRVLVINDGSNDKTAEIINKYPEIEVITNQKNLGKGESMKIATEKAIKDGSDIVLFMDGDLQHKAKDINRFLSVFQENKDIDIVFGARKIGKNMRLVKFIGNKTLTVIINILFRYFLNDTQCGFRGFRSKVFNKIKWNSKDYSVETEMVINSAINNIPYKEVEIETIYMDHKKGTKIRDGIKILFKILFWRIIK